MISDLDCLVEQDHFQLGALQPGPPQVFTHTAATLPPTAGPAAPRQPGELGPGCHPCALPPKHVRLRPQAVLPTQEGPLPVHSSGRSLRWW